MFNPKLYEEITLTKPNLEKVKQRYGLADRAIAENNSLEHARDLDSLTVKDSISIPANYIDKYVDKN
jgi:hypothetical protein